MMSQSTRQEIIDNFINEHQGVPPKGASSFSVSGVHFDLKYFRLRASELGWVNGVQTIAPTGYVESVNDGDPKFKTGGFVDQAVKAETDRLLTSGFNLPSANKYHRQITGFCGTTITIDVYRVLHAFPSGMPEIDHALKKLLAPGQRGVKSQVTDMREAIQSIECAIKYLEDVTDE